MVHDGKRQMTQPKDDCTRKFLIRTTQIYGDISKLSSSRKPPTLPLARGYKHSLMNFLFIQSNPLHAWITILSYSIAVSLEPDVGPWWRRPSGSPQAWSWSTSLATRGYICYLFGIKSLDVLSFDVIPVCVHENTVYVGPFPTRFNSFRTSSTCLSNTMNYS